MPYMLPVKIPNLSEMPGGGLHVTKASRPTSGTLRYDNLALAEWVLHKSTGSMQSNEDGVS